MSVKFRASTVGNLMVGSNEITDRQLSRLKELEDRQADPNAKPLTAKMQEELAGLIEKRDSEFRFGATAKTYIRNCWLLNEYGCQEPVLTPQMLKGMVCELDSIGLLDSQVPSVVFRAKNEQRFENEWFTGEPDLLTDDWVEDVKTSWSLQTFFNVSKPDPIYYAQGQVYMDLTGKSRFRLAHVLVDTPPLMLQEECRRYAWKFEGNEDHPEYKQIESRLNALHKVSHIPESKRIKVFEFERDDEFLDTLKSRVEQARRYYSALSLEGMTQ